MTKLRIKDSIVEGENERYNVTLWLDYDEGDRSRIALYGYDDEKTCKLIVFDPTGKVFTPKGHGIVGLRTDGNGRLVVDTEY